MTLAPSQRADPDDDAKGGAASAEGGATWSRPTRLTLAAWLVIILAASRAIWLAWADHRLTFGTAIPSDLVPILQYHGSLRGWFPRPFAELLVLDGLRPPLYHAGVALLTSPWQRVPTIGPAVVNALALVLTAELLRRELARSTTQAVALLGVVTFLCLRGVLGLASRPGCELVHAALLFALLARLAAVRRGQTRRAGVALGLLLGSGLLVRWNFAAYALPPMALMAGEELLRMRGRPATLTPGLKAIGVSICLGLLLFAPWLLFSADGERARSVLSSELIGTPGFVGGVAFYVREAGSRFLGPQALPLGLIVLAAAGLRTGAGSSDWWIWLAALGGGLLAHSVIAHREARYLLPLAPVATFLVFELVDRAWSRGPRWRGSVIASVALLGVSLAWMPPRTPGWARSGGEAAFGDLVFWPVGASHDTDTFFAPLSQGNMPNKCVTVAPTGASPDNVFVWVAAELLSRGHWPILWQPDEEAASRASCGWLITNGGQEAERTNASFGGQLQLRRELVLETPWLDDDSRAFRLWWSSGGH